MAASAHCKTPSNGSAGSGSLLGSPTLTNPDLILPYYEDALSSPPEHAHSSFMMWKNANVDMHQFDLGAHTFSEPDTPTTEIIYGNGTMLSDIGEVTEAESIREPAKVPRSSRHGYAGHDAETKSTHSVQHFQVLQKKLSRERERRLSMESTSTETVGDQLTAFPDFDDSVSMDDSNFQGDDEDSVAESYVYDDEPSAASGRNGAPMARDEVYNGFVPVEDRYSTALSRRAEQILANAKRRLTTMEGNLSRARTSFSSSMGSRSTPSPSGGQSLAAHLCNAKPRSGPGHGHNRVFSENNIVAEVKPGPASASPRAASALGAAGGYRQPLQTSKSADSIHEKAHRGHPTGDPIYANATFAKSKASLHDSLHILETLSEVDIPEVPQLSPSSQGTKINLNFHPSSGSSDGRASTRSVSTVHIKDLKDHMEDLKGRLSSLREQARADSANRQSMMSMRSPSPSTHARVDEWYVEHNEDDAIESMNGRVHPWSGSGSSVGRGSNHSRSSQRKPLSPGQESFFSGNSEYETPLEPGLVPVEEDEMPDGFVDIVDEDDYEDTRTEIGYSYQSEQSQDLDDGLSESGESLYHDSVQIQMSHEDREDAFDYEHFFLHSAMGSINRRQKLMGARRDSFSSEDSVETTRGPAATVAVKRRRRASDASISTMESFATATETTAGNSESHSADDAADGVADGITDGVAESETDYTPSTTAGSADDDASEVTPYDPAEENEQDGTDAVDAAPVEQTASPVGRRDVRSPDPKRTTFGLVNGSAMSSPARSPKYAPATRRSVSGSCRRAAHRPSVSSFESTGTTRSFPLVNRGKKTDSISTTTTTTHEPPEEEEDESSSLKQIAESIMSETASICESFVGGDNSKAGPGAAPIQTLDRDDQILVERLVASLGKCVLGLTESGRASEQGGVYRRRMETARWLLEGIDGPA